jgi:hypothetical protein
MSTSGVIVISGATGPFSACINGPYDPTSETSGGYTVYSKRGDASMCIEHYGGRWQVKPLSYKGKDTCFALIAGDCALEACASRVWKVHDGENRVDQPSMKIVAGPDAEREVSGCCICPT